MTFQPDDIVRIVAIEPGSMVESYLGCEGRVLAKHPELPLYTVEIDVGRRNLDRAGQMGPHFVLREDQLFPEVTAKMLAAGFAAVRAASEIAAETLIPPTPDELHKLIYRAMREARFER